MSIPILLYHSVSSDPALGAARWAVPPDQFARHVDLIAACGRNTMTISGIAEGIRRGTLPEALLGITFDDGYADTVDAANLLGSRGLSCTVYVTSGWLGRSSMLDESALLMLASMPGVEIGAHSVDHRRLDELRSAEIAAEVRDSRATLEAILSSPVSSFAYPHGAYDRRVRREVAAQGYASAAAVKNALSNPTDDPFALARVTIGAGTSIEYVKRLTEGRGAPSVPRGTKIRTRAYRTIRRVRRQLASTG